MQEIQTRTATFSLSEKDLVKVVMKEGAEVGLDESRENYEATMALTKGARYLVLVDAKANSTITPEGREFSTRPECYKNVIAMGVVVQSLATRLLANFLASLHKRNKGAKMKIFNTEEATLLWLHKMREEEEKRAEDKTQKLMFLD